MMTKGPAVGYIYPLDTKTVSIGRDLSNDIVIQDPEVSRHHLRLTYTRRGYMIEDLETTNGTMVNDDSLREQRCLEPNDVIKLGTMVQLQYMFREVSQIGEDDTPSHRPSEFVAHKDDTLMSVIPTDTLTRRPVSAREIGLEPGALFDHLVIVYAREDWEGLVAPLLVRLQDTRLNAWVDQYLALGSDEWRMAVEQALAECWLMVIVVTPNSLQSNYVKLMYRHFLSEDKPVIPLIADSMQTLPGELNRLRTIVFDSDNHQRAFHKLIFEIMQLRKQG
jgi:pSer/pThr/pTyr-binding forkhead associated (FHA) protein